MPLPSTSTFDWYGWVILPVIVFLARITDVSLGTVRILLLGRGNRIIPPLLGFLEVFIWITVIGQLVQYVHNIPAYIGYAAGFAVGNYFGLWIERWLVIGTYLIRLILKDEGEQIAQSLRQAGFGVTRLVGEGSSGSVHVIYTIVRRRDVEHVLALLHVIAPQTFISLEEVRSTERGFFPPLEKPHNIFLTRRKAK